MTQSVLSVDDLLGLAQDLEDGFNHRNDTDSECEFVLDANVMWVFQNILDFEDKRFGGNTEKTLGRRNAISLMRWSLQQLLENRHEILMLEPHKFETDVAFAARNDWDYESIAPALEKVLSAALEKENSSSIADLCHKVVEKLRHDFPGEFFLLTDVLGKGIDKKKELDRYSRTMKAIDRSDVPSSLRTTLTIVGTILREGDNRATFSVSQDVRALLDLALINAQKGTKKTILLTLDKKLLDAVRLVRAWNEPWSDLLLIESFDTFWAWDINGQDGSFSHFGFSQIRNVLDDYRIKAKRMFQKADDYGHMELWVTHRKWLSALAETREEKDEYEIGTRIKQTLDEQRRNAISGTDVVELQKKCAAFFAEVEEMLPSIQIVTAQEQDRSEILSNALVKHDLSLEQFMTSLSDDIQEHAKESLKIIGAASMFAPKVVQAIETYTRATAFDSPSASFIHRLPVPIQSDEFDLNQVIELVRNTSATSSVRFDELLKLTTWRGSIADLVMAYLLVHAGDWRDAEDICASNLNRNRWGSESDDPILYEIALLEAAILRIYRTSEQKLERADELLRKALECPSRRPSMDPADFRIKLELQAVAVNSILLRKYRHSHYPLIKLEMDKWATQHDELFESLIGLKREAASYFAALGSEAEERKDAAALKEKLEANANVNIVLLFEFVTGGSSQSSPERKSAYHAVLEEGIERLSDRKSRRISHFEEVVMSYAILSNSTDLSLETLAERDLFSSLRNKLGRLLQRKDDFNEFEYWICRNISLRMKEIGYLG